MYRFTVGLAVVGLACGSSTSGSTDQAVVPPADLTIPAGATRTVDGVVIGFVKVNEDSRCPVDVQCVWAGNAAVQLSLASGGAQPMQRVVNSGAEPRTIEEYGLRITFKDLTPYPRQGTADTTTPVVVLRVEKP